MEADGETEDMGSNSVAIATKDKDEGFNPMRMRSKRWGHQIPRLQKGSNEA